MKKVAVFGVKGLLGEALVRHLSNLGCEVISLTRAECDLSDEASLNRVLSGLSCDSVMNASGMTGLEACLDNPDVAKQLNVEAPAMMAASCAERGMSFVHFSTDYVFDGEKHDYLTELSEPRAVSVYGQTKLEGEQKVLSVNPQALVCRVSWLFGRGRPSFVDQVVQHALNGNPQSYIADKYSVPNFADDLAAMCVSLLDKDASGVVHLCSQGGEVTWYTYAQAVLNILSRTGKVGSVNGLLNRSKLVDVTAFRATRPRYTSMKSVRLVEEFGVTPANWRDGLERYLRELP